MQHQLKISSKYFDAVNEGIKKFEIRKDDRDYQVGDVVQFLEFDDGKYSGRKSDPVVVVYVLRNAEKYGLNPGYCIIGF